MSQSQYPNRGALRDEDGSVRLSPGHPYFLAVEMRSVLLLRTEPTRTLRWKYAIRDQPLSSSMGLGNMARGAVVQQRGEISRTEGRDLELNPSYVRDAFQISISEE